MSLNSGKIFLINLIIILYCYSTTANNEHDEPPERFQVVGFHWSHVSAAYSIAIWILIASLSKICKYTMHLSP